MYDDTNGRLSCDMDHDCKAEVTHVDQDGFVYCTDHGLARRLMATLPQAPPVGAAQAATSGAYSTSSSTPLLTTWRSGARTGPAGRTWVSSDPTSPGCLPQSGTVLRKWVPARAEAEPSPGCWESGEVIDPEVADHLASSRGLADNERESR